MFSLALVDHTKYLRGCMRTARHRLDSTVLTEPHIGKVDVLLVSPNQLTMKRLLVFLTVMAHGKRHAACNHWTAKHKQKTGIS